ncbi:ATP-binding protein [Candidatus Babeliales bacterium]|nr:ATP-binding protein [Candidatus Babeliales bacterium]
MKRFVDYFLIKWKSSPLRKPLLIRGARQVGKTYSAREFGKTFDSFIELNLELEQDAREIFEKSLDPNVIIQKISALTGKRIIPGQTLLFLDEIQLVPQAVTALRYFYEMMPELHVIAAGSLLDFAIKTVGMPVGRVSSLYMHPLSFIEFLRAIGSGIIIEEILNHELKDEMLEVLHNKFLDLVGQYLAIGGMPQAVACWKNLQDIHLCSEIPNTLISTYRQDFEKYAQKYQIKYLNVLFNNIPHQLGRKFKYNEIEGEYRKRELSPCLDLLLTAHVAHKVMRTSAQGIPLGAGVDLHSFKILLIDVALSQFILGLKTGNWILKPLEEFINKGELVESFVGQEILAYENPTRESQLYYWQNESRGSEAEIDYVIQKEKDIIPVEVKSGKGTAMKSMKIFLENHAQSPYGIRFSTNNYSEHEKIHSYPLYAVAKIIADADIDVKSALLLLSK